MSKKGGYDLGRKSVYYMLVLVVIAILFAYVGSTFSRYMQRNTESFPSIAKYALAERVIGCVTASEGASYYPKIDPAKFTDAVIAECISGEPYYEGRTVKVTAGDLSAQNRKEGISTYFELPVLRLVELNGKIETLSVEVSRKK